MGDRCKLCLSTSKLCNSHIIPEWCYKAMYDDKHRGRSGKIDITAEADLRWVMSYFQKGFREFLLCSDCELLLSKTERWFAEFWCNWSGWKDWKENIKNEINHCTIAGADYRKFKLFHLSILWRASIARGEPFQEVSLGPYEETLRTMLINGDAGTPYSFPVYGTLLTGHDGNLQRRLMYSPVRSKYNNTTLYFFVFAGCEWLYVLSDHIDKVSEPLKTIVLKMNLTQEQNDLRLWVQPYDCSNTLRIWVGKRRKSKTMHLAFPNVHLFE